jgi:hypothetical protein
VNTLAGKNESDFPWAKWGLLVQKSEEVFLNTVTAMMYSPASQGTGLANSNEVTSQRDF